MKNKYLEFDKSITKQIMSEFRGKTIEVICQWCKGNDKQCKDCGGKGRYKLQF